MGPVTNRRADQEQKSSIVGDYNGGMSVVDSTNHMLSYNPTLRKTLHGIKRLVFTLLRSFY